MNKSSAFIFSAVAALSLLLTACPEQDKDSQSQITKLSELDSPLYSIGVPAESAALIAVKTRYPASTVIQYTNTRLAYDDLRNGKLDAFVFDEHVLESVAKKDERLVLAEEKLSDEHIGVGIRLEDTAMRTEINSFIRELRKDNVYTEMYDRWLISENPQMPKIPVPENPARVIRIGTEGRNVPMNYYDERGNLSGFDIEFARRLGAALNARIEITTMPFASLVPALNEKRIDLIIANLNATRKRMKKIAMSDSYIETYISALFRKDRLEEPLHKITYAGSRVGVLAASTGEAFVKHHHPGADVIPFDEYSDAVAALNAGKIDFVVGSFTSIHNYALVDPSIFLRKDPLSTDGNAIAVKKGNKELVGRINDTLRSFKSDGTLDRIAERWVKTSISPYKLEPFPAHGDGFPVLRVAVAADREPICFTLNGNYAGFDCELIERIAYELGMRVDYRNMKFSELLKAVEKGEADVAISNITRTDERAKLVDFSLIYFDNPQTLLAKKDARPPQDNAADIASLSGRIRQYFINAFVVEKRGMQLIDGLCVTLMISAGAILLGTVLGCGLCIFRSFGTLAAFSVDALVFVLKGTPVLIVMMLLYYVVFLNVGVSGVTAATLAFSLNFAAYGASLFRKGAARVDAREKDAARALGFSEPQVLFRIVMPQATGHVFPQYIDAVATVIKLTSVVGYIAVRDLTNVADMIRIRSFDAVMPLVTSAVVYIVIVYSVTGVLTLIAKLIYGRRKKASGTECTCEAKEI